MNLDQITKRVIEKLENLHYFDPQLLQTAPVAAYKPEKDAVKSFIVHTIKEVVGETEKQNLQNIGFLRRWLNEDRIKDPKYFVTNELLKHWLSTPSKEDK